MKMTKASQRWDVSPIGRGSIKYSWLECLRELTNLRMYGSKSLGHRNVSLRVFRSWCGRVRIVFMKYHVVLQAHPSQQAYSKNLKVYAQIRLSEQGKVSGISSEI